MEGKASSTDHHAAVTSTGSSGGEDLHRQVRNYTFKKKKSEANRSSDFFLSLFSGVIYSKYYGFLFCIDCIMY